jgi:hypothetical protein
MALDLRAYAAPLLVSGTSGKLLTLGDKVECGEPACGWGAGA